MNKGLTKYGTAGLLFIVATAGITSGCASKKYVRTQVNTSANEISAKMDTKDTELQNGIEANSGQITELSGVTRDHTQKINTLDVGLQAADGKATQAMNVGQGAQKSADQANGYVTRLDGEFQNRNNYSTVNEHSVLFGFGSSTLKKDADAELNEIAQAVKSSPNQILVLEGRTDATGDVAYNIQLGEKRLDAVIRYLVVEQGVPMQQIYKMSFGAAKPVADNKTREGRAQNRAVVVRVMEPKLDGQTNNTVSDAGSLNR
jgi:outer membrane protein OmpA-like peptidoglycan-associated protein